jgi:hypothetical protein
MAGRSVGSISVTVDADTGKLKAQMVRDGKVAGKAAAEAIESELDNIQANIDLHEEDARAGAKLLAKQIEQSLKNIPVDIDVDDAVKSLAEIKTLGENLDVEPVVQFNTVQAKKDLAKFKEFAEAQRLAIDVTLDARSLSEVNARLAEFKKKNEDFELDTKINAAKLNAELAAWERTVRRREVDLPINGDFTHVNAGLEKLRLKAAYETVDVEFKPDLTEINAALLDFRRDRTITFDARLDVAKANAGIKAFTANNRTIDMVADADLTKINLSLAAFRKKQEANAINLKVKTDNASLANWSKSLSSAGSGAGDSSGGFFADSFGKAAKVGINRQGEAIAAAIFALGEPIVGAVAGLSASAIAVVASAGNALAGILGAGLPLAVGFGAALGGVIFALQGMGDAYTAAVQGDTAAFNKALEKMTENGKAFAIVLRDDVVPAVNTMRNQLQSTLFAGLDTALKSFIDRGALANLTTGLQALLVPVNDFAKKMLDLLSRIDFAKLFTNLAPGIDSVLDGVRALTGGFFQFIEAATPAANRFAAMLHTAAVGFADFDSGDVAEFLDRGLDSLRVWLDLFGAIGDVIAAVWVPAIDSGDSLISDLTGKVREFAQYLTDNQDAVADFFRKGEDVVKSFGPVLEGLQQGIALLFTDETIGRMTEFLDKLGEGLPLFAGLLDGIGDTDIASALMQGLNDVLSAMLPIIQSLAPVVANLFENFDTLGPILVALLVPGGALLKLLVLLAEPISQVVDQLAGPLGTALESVATLMQLVADVLGELIVAFAPTFVELLATSLAHVAEVATTLFDALSDAGVIDILAEGFTAVVEALSPLLPAISKLAKTILPPLAKAFATIADAGIDVILGLFEALVPAIVLLADTLAPIVAQLLPVLAEAWRSVADAVLPILPLLGEALTGVIKALSPLLQPLADLFMALVPSIVELNTAFIPLLPALLEIVVSLTPLLELLANLAALVLDVVTPAITGIVEALAGFVDIMVDVADAVLGFVNDVIGFFQELFDVLVGNSIIPELMTAIVGAFAGMIADTISAIAGWIADMIGKVARFAIDFGLKIGGMLTGAITAVGTFVADMIGKFVGLWSDLVGKIVGFGITFALKLAGFWRDALSNVGDFIGDFIDFFTDLPGDIVSAVTKGASSLISLGKSIVNWVIEGIGSIGSAIGNKIKSLVPTSIAGVNLPWGATGGLFDKPTVIGVGERGREALVPLDLPLGQVDPSVRQMSAMLRGIPMGGSTSSVTNNRNVNNEFHIYEAENADATAQRVVNRMAMVA